MLNPDSPIIDFYPEDVPVDPNGKAMPWLWVVLLPFIDEGRLHAATKGLFEKFTESENKVAAVGIDEGKLYFSQKHELNEMIPSKNNEKDYSKAPPKSLGDASRWGGFTGYIRVSPADCCGEDDSDAKCVIFKSPRCTKHRSTVLRGTKPPPPTLEDSDRNIARPRLNRGQNIAHMGVTPFGAVQQRNLGFNGQRQQHHQHHNFQRNPNPFAQQSQIQRQAFSYGLPPRPSHGYQPQQLAHSSQASYRHQPPPNLQQHQQRQQGFSFATNYNYNPANARQLRPPPPASQHRIHELRDELRNTLAAQHRPGNGQNKNQREYK